ncbi:hypothetical protein ABG768_010689 [Culter alburnus]|uniref:Transthyretin n=1 Tax=Culter alburnus TaxID=194366 RepID=A0AAW1ZAU5_CULAL
MNMAATLPSPLTIHVLNTAQGVPGANMTIILYRLDPISSVWNLLTTGITNDDGRCPGLISKESFIAGVYKMRFETGKYWDALGETCFYPYVELHFYASLEDVIHTSTRGQEIFHCLLPSLQ